MRFSLATASLAVSVALLAGCSASQGTQSLPSSSLGAQSLGAIGHPDMRNFHHITPMQLLKMQAEVRSVDLFHERSYVNSSRNSKARADRTLPRVAR